MAAYNMSRASQKKYKLNSSGTTIKNNVHTYNITAHLSGQQFDIGTYVIV